MAGPYTYLQIGRRRGDLVTFAVESEDCSCTPAKGVRQRRLYKTVVLDPECPVHQNAPNA